MNWKTGGVRLGAVAAMAVVLFGIKEILGFETAALSGIGIILVNQIFNKDQK